MMTVWPVPQAVAQTARELAAAGVSTPRVDAELLVAHVLGLPRSRLVLAGELTGAQWAQLRLLARARATRVPLQYLTGWAGFGRIELAVGPGAFVPRPETELVLAWAVRAAPRATVVVDLCSGTGALALSLAYELPHAQVYAVESSPPTLSWLWRNAAQRAAAGDRPVEVVVGDATAPAVLAGRDGGVDLVVCNPPYVPAGTPVPPEVSDHDPPEAVFAGADGLAVIRGIIPRAAALLRPGGRLAIEHDDTHAAAVPGLLWADGRFTEVADHADLAGRPRFATATRSGEGAGAAG